MPHHGSKTSSTGNFIQTVSPKIALIAAGYRSRFGHPKAEIVQRYESMGVELMDTVDHGAIRLEFPLNDAAISRYSYRKHERGFWSR